MAHSYQIKKWGNKGISYRELQSNEAQNLDLEVYKSKNYYTYIVRKKSIKRIDREKERESEREREREARERGGGVLKDSLKK